MDDPNDWAELLEAATRHALVYRRELPGRAVAPAATAEAMTQAMADLVALPERGLGAQEVLEELVQRATPGLTAMSGPRFFGWVTGGTLSASVAADWLTSLWDQNAGPAEGAPAAIAFENLALGWVKELLALPSAAQGALVTGAMAANFTALAVARSAVLAAVGWDVERDGLCDAPRIQVLSGHERHGTIDKALRLLGLGKRCLRPVACDGEGRLSPSALARELSQTVGPVIVCAQAGNVNSGAFDPLTAIHTELARYRAGQPEGACWLHVDGAFGLWARAATSTRELALGAELADSWATDAHKFLNVPYDCGIVLTRHPRAHRRALAVQGAYLSSGSAASVTAPGVFTPELSRRARGFALYAALRQLGRRGVDALVTRCVNHAQRLARELEGIPSLHVENRVVFNQVVVSAEPPTGTPRDEWLQRLIQAIQAEGTCYPTPTLWRGLPALRFSLINADTTEGDVHRSARAVGEVTRALWARAGGCVE